MSDKTIVIRLVARANQYTAEMRRAGAETGAFAVQVSRGAQQAGGAVKALGTASAFAGKLMVVGIGGAMAVSAKAAIEFESSLAGVSKTVDFTGTRFANAASPIAAFGDALRSLSTRIPISVNELAKIAEVGGQLGVNPENLIEFTEVMAALGVTTNLSAEEAATGLARFANIMGTSQGDFDVLGSIIVELGNNLATTEGEILTFATRIASAGQVIGATEADILAIAGALSSLGVPAERGGTAVQRVFVDMANAVAEGGAKLNLFAETAGMTAEEFATAFRDTPGEAFVSFIQGLDGITQAGGNVFQTLDRLGLNQVRTSQVLLAAAGGAELVARSLEMANAEAKENNALTEEAGKRYATTESQIRLAANAFKDLTIEVGNLMLGSGGIAFGIDALSAFFGIIKGNLDVIGSFVSGLVVLGGLKLAQVFMKGIGALFTFTSKLKGATAGVKAMGVAAATINLATLGAAAAAGILLAVWADAAIKAAQFRQITREVTENLAQGASEAEAIVKALEGKEIGGFFGFGAEEIFDEDTVRNIQEIFGMSPEQFVNAMLEGADAVQVLETRIQATRDAMADKKDHQITDDDKQMLANLEEMESKAADLQVTLEGLEASQVTSLTSAFFELRGPGQENFEIFSNLARVLTDIHGLGLSAADAMAIAFGGRGRNFARRGGGPPDLEQTAKDVPRHWSAIVLAMEDGEDKVDDFYSSMEESTTEFNDMMREKFEEVSEIIRSGFPAWDEYEQESITSLSKVTDAQDRFLKDMVAWGEARAGILGVASTDTLAWLDSLDAPTKGAMARFAADNNTAWLAFIADTNANFAELMGVTNLVWTQDMPEVVRAGLGMMFEIAREKVDALGLVGEDYRAALLEGMNLQLAATGFGGQLEELIFTDHDARMALFKSMGFDLTAQLFAGILEGMGNFGGLGRDAFGESVDEFNDYLKNELGVGWEAQSPSQWMIRFFRDDVMGGAAIGVREGMPPLANLLNGLPQGLMQPPSSPIVNVASPGTSRNSEINIIHPNTKNLKEDLRLATVMAGSASEFGG